jgi:hypothetical protein
MAKLTECGRILIERPNVTLRLTINPQRGLTGVSEDDVPGHIEQISNDLQALSATLNTEANEVADIAESKACEQGDTSNGEIVARHCDARKLSTDSNGSSFYLRVEMTSTRTVPQLAMAMLADALLEHFMEFVYSMIEKKTAKPSIVTLANLSAVALTNARPHSKIIWNDEPQLGDRA